MTITTNTTDRKALVKAIAEELGTESTYLRAPTYAYQIGDFTVDRDGNIIGEDFGALQDFLARNGYELPDQMTSPMRKRLLIQKRSPSPAWRFQFRRGMPRWHS